MEKNLMIQIYFTAINKLGLQPVNFINVFYAAPKIQHNPAYADTANMCLALS